MSGEERPVDTWAHANRELSKDHFIAIEIPASHSIKHVRLSSCVYKTTNMCWLKIFHGRKSRITVNHACFFVTLPDDECGGTRQKINQGIDNYQLSNRLSVLEARTGLVYIHGNNRKSIWKIELLTNVSGWPARLGQHWIMREIMAICKWPPVD